MQRSRSRNRITDLHGIESDQNRGAKGVLDRRTKIMLDLHKQPNQVKETRNEENIVENVKDLL